ncbi:MAG: hypothetical protein D6826_09245, partial [Alphaproteobacteria bacterium]
MRGVRLRTSFKLPLVLLVIVMLASIGAVCAVAVAQTTPQRPFARVVEEWTTALDRAAQELAAPEISPARAQALQRRLRGIEAEARAIKADATAALAPLRSQLEALGPPPAEGDQPEAPEIAAERQRILQDITDYESRIKQADLAIARVKEISDQIAARTLQQSLDRLFRKFPSPLAPHTLKVAVPELVEIVGLLAGAPVEWWQGLSPEQRWRGLPYRLGALVLFALVVGWGGRWALLHWFGRTAAIERPSYARRLTGAVAHGLAQGLIPALIFGIILYGTTVPSNLLNGLFARMVAALSTVLILIVLAWAIPRAVLAPDWPAWRLLPISSTHARMITRRITFLAVVFGVDLFFALASANLVLSDALISLYTLITKVLEAAAILALLDVRLWQWEEEEKGPAAEAAPTPPGGEAPRRMRVSYWSMLRRLVGVAAIAAVIMAAIGYPNLSRYVIQNLLLSGLAVGVLFLIRGVIRELIGMALRARFVQVQLGLPHKIRSRYKFWLRVLLDFVVHVAGLVVILIIWGVPAETIAVWAADALQEIRIGNVTISLVDILVAVAVFTLVLILTRALQRMLAEQVFPHTDLDIGVRNSLSAGLGYV